MKSLIGKTTVIVIFMFLSLLITSVASGFTEGDALTAGDVDGDGWAEIIHGDTDNWIQIFAMNGNPLKRFFCEFNNWDGLAAGNVVGDGKAEIIHGDRAGLIRIFDMNGNPLYSFPLDFDDGDALTAGDVDGDGWAEIIHGDTDNWIHIFDIDGSFPTIPPEPKSFSLNFNNWDGLAAGNVVGDGKAEIIHGDRAGEIKIFDMNGEELEPYSFPLDFVEKDGLTAGDVDGDGWAEIIHGDRHDKIQIFDIDGAIPTIPPKSFKLDFEEGDALTAGDVNGDGKAEIIHGDRVDLIQIFAMNGALIESFLPYTVPAENVWFNNKRDIGYSNQDWMGQLDDNLLISELSIPGTHDTMSHYGNGTPAATVKCQTFRLKQQLKSGIRALDIRCRHIDNKFSIHHGKVFQNAWFDEVLDICIQFLDYYPTETILMRIKKEHTTENCTRGFEETFKWYMSQLYMDQCEYGSKIWQSEDYTEIPTLGEVRGKIVILQGFVGERDGLTAGNVVGDEKAEIIHGHRGDWMQIFDMEGNLLKRFELDFEAGDGLTAGDVDKDGWDEIIHGDKSEDKIQIFDMEGNRLNYFGLHFEDGWGLTAGDVNKDGKAEIIQVYEPFWPPQPPLIAIFDMEGNLLNPLWGAEAGDGLTAGNVVGDGKAEIIHGDRWDYWGNSFIQIFNMEGNRLKRFELDFEAGDGLTAGDVDKDGWAEIIHGDKSEDKIQIFDMEGNLLNYFELHFEDGDGLTAGDVNKDDCDTSNCTAEIIHGDRDNWIRIFDKEGNLLNNFQLDFENIGPFGIPWSSFNIQDAFKMYATWDSFNTKWNKIRNHLDYAHTGSSDEIYVNFTSGSTWVNPVDVARGLLSGSMVEGMNERTYLYLRQKLDLGELWRTGLIMMDFPGGGLIDVIIAHNGLDLILENDVPEADANGPYVSDEGSEIEFDASASFDPDGDALQYRWDFDDDGIWDAEWSSSPTVVFTLYDDYTGFARLEVTDEKSASDIDTAEVTVNNVAPTTTIESIISPVEGCILPGQEVGFVGSFTDPGCLDTHTAQWDFGDGSIVPGTLTEENDEPDATGSVEDGHIYGEPGIFTVLWEILDDDGGIGTDEIEVQVMTASEAVDFADSFIQDLPESCFKRPADNRKNAFSNKFKAVKNALGAGDIRGAINKLMNDIRAKADGSVGGKSSNDWITDEEAQEGLCLVIDELVKYLASL